MTNPWMKRNPWLSMWMSGANAVFGTARGTATAEARRYAKAMTANAVAETMRFWVSATTPARKKSRK